MKKNKSKGFTMVELLGAITIMGILMLSAGVAVSIHVDRSRDSAYDTMAMSAKNAATQYLMEYPGYAMTRDEYNTLEEKRLNNEAYDDSKIITFEELVKSTQMTAATDPSYKGTQCTGRVIIILNDDPSANDRTLDSYSFVVHECCVNKKTKYTYTEEYRKKGTEETCDPSNDEDCNIVEVTGKEEAAVWCD